MITHASPYLTDLSLREKLILAGLYLSKYDLLGVKALGFDSFLEAFNVIGFALGSKPASVKNYRDEFDPLFPNQRKGWHKRATRAYCLVLFERYRDLDFASFTEIIRSFFVAARNVDSSDVDLDEGGEGLSSFAQRLITGLAAEHYFESVCPKLPEFSGYLVENTTRLGCGYDFRLRSEPGASDFLAVEVKGLRDQSGSIALTSKEYSVALALSHRFFLFVVRNFREFPVHTIFPNPTDAGLKFTKTERVVVQTSWYTKI